MSLQRGCRRKLAGAWGVAVFVPGTSLIMLAVLGLTGGFVDLGTLRQLVSGPAAPASLESLPRRAHRPTVRGAIADRLVAAPIHAPIAAGTGSASRFRSPPGANRGQGLGPAGSSSDGLLRGAR